MVENNQFEVEQENNEQEVSQSEENTQVEQVQEQPKESSSERNFKALREKAERAERERDELIQKMRDIETAKQKVQEEQDDDWGISEDDIVEGKHLRKLKKELRNLQSQLKDNEQRSYQMALEARLKIQFPDFDSVVSKENVEKLQKEYPEIAATLSSSKDLYSSAVSAYTFIKKIGISEGDSYEREHQRVAKNSSKPRPLASVSPQSGETPLSHANAFANGLTEELKAQLWKEMQDAIKGY